ncbi:MAG: nucleotidyltransferase family protein [Sulfurisoma sp.]|nr:nucleotidyltransferase family protein [Sulfurisoma sp.]
MNRATVMEMLKRNSEIIRTRFGARRLSLFGSAARDEMRDDSDVDILVEFDGSPTFDGYMGLLAYLEELMHAKVDLATEAMIKPRLRAYIEKDLVRVA